jgi:hypothetical protein
LYGCWGEYLDLKREEFVGDWRLLLLLLLLVVVVVVVVVINVNAQALGGIPFTI